MYYSGTYTLSIQLDVLEAKRQMAEGSAQKAKASSLAVDITLV